MTECKTYSLFTSRWEHIRNLYLHKTFRHFLAKAVTKVILILLFVCHLVCYYSNTKSNLSNRSEIH